MALVLAYEDAKVNQRTKSGTVLTDGKLQQATHTRFFGSRDEPDFPSARLSQHGRGAVSTTHFHIVDQFQVAVEGKGTLGRNDYSRYSVHFSRAYTPYGPLVADVETGFTHFALRRRYDPGAQHSPEALESLKQVADRNPWQVTRQVTFPETGSCVSLQLIPDMQDDSGLAGYALRMRPNTRTYAPDPSRGDGQYVLAVGGSLVHENKEQKAYVVVFIYPHEDAFCIHAGPEGLEALVLSFPRPRTGLSH